MKRHHHSVYEPLTLCNLLERAGAIAQTDENGTPLAEVEQEPLRVEVEASSTGASPRRRRCSGA